MSNSVNVKVSLPLIPVVYVILIIAKIMGVLQWSWFVVLTSFIWMFVGIFLIAAIFVVLYAILVAIFS